MSLLGGLTETLALRFYGWLGPRFFSRRYFEYRYRRRMDPWSYESSPYEKRKYQQTLEILTRPRYERVLEVGCSIGVFTEQLAQQGIAREILGIDLASAALDRARVRLERFKHVELRCLDITRDPLVGPFDLVFCAEVLYYLGGHNIRVVLEKILSALQEDGQLVLVNPWPLSHQFHRRFFQRPELRLLQERVERDSERPYSIALFAKEPRRSNKATKAQET
ncbi:MAG: hypothetical protein A2Z21_05640 [Candidatus Fraserbacteria bacterium RBG_16_55_9]|uniref:Methyltransferase domain-containing protein n=1 Tax=Fraserbacteria sp. (strain RBG_16_55_9) TaxID=1817864 RepID=A0A1F5UQR2_FRAXR|nr:MAG: hypothetical protein A2Z21_05640 [Candidatus Fraserbacteria bacterium RBG_16_55_9]